MWFKVDDKLHGHRKPRAAGKAAMGVWVLAGSWVADHGTDGFVPASYLPLWGTKGDARRLVEAGLWSVHTDEHGEKGWLFHDWAKFQPSAAQVEAEREKARRRMSRLRSGERSPEPAANVRDTFATPSRPDPTVVQVVGQSGSAARALDRLTDDDLEQIRHAVGGTSSADARRVAETVLGKTTQPVAAPGRYVLAAVRENPAAYRCARRTSRKADECPDHPGSPASNCSGCAADRLAGGDR